MMDMKKISENLNKLKYPAIILLVGIMLMLMPTGTKKSEGGKAGNTDFAELLSSIEGVGEAKVLISESGVVVVCKGAANATVRLKVTNAVRSYTGFSTEKITILKMTEQ